MFKAEEFIGDWESPVDLSSVHACQTELQLCSTALTYFDHMFAKALDERDKAQRAWNTVESDAAKKAREDAPKAATATEIKGLITAWVNRHPSAAEDREKAEEAHRRIDKLERKMRTAEKRMSAAQSAQNGHDQLQRGGGGG